MNTSPVRKTEIVWEELDGEALLVDTTTKSSWLLNPTATLIWCACAGAHPLTELARALARKTGAEVRKVEREITGFCRRLEEAGLLGTAGTPAGTVSMAFTGLGGSYIAPEMRSLHLTGAGRGRRPSPRGNSGPG